jgi:hypothetical protein
MFSLGLVLLVLCMALAGFNKARRSGTWRWSKFALTLSFLAVVIVIVTVPIFLMNQNSPYFLPVYLGLWGLSLALIIAFAFWARTWKLTGARASVETDRNQPPR